MDYLARLLRTGTTMERAGILGRTKVMAAMLLLDVFSVSELAEQASVSYGTVVGVIGTMPDNSMEVYPTSKEEPLRYQLTQEAFFMVQAELATLTDAPELLPFSTGSEIPLLLSVAKTHLLALDVGSRRNTALEQQRIASHLDVVEKALVTGPSVDWAGRQLMDVEGARFELEHHIRKLFLS